MGQKYSLRRLCPVKLVTLIDHRIAILPFNHMFEIIVSTMQRYQPNFNIMKLVKNLCHLRLARVNYAREQFQYHLFLCLDWKAVQTKLVDYSGHCIVADSWENNWYLIYEATTKTSVHFMALSPSENRQLLRDFKS